MIRAGSLTYAIFLAVITAVLCSMMILLAFHYRSYFIKMDVHEVLKDNAHSGVALAMSMRGNTDMEQRVDLFRNGADSVHLKKRRWGCYHVVSSMAVKGDENYKKTALIGSGGALTDNVALWLTDHNRPLNVAGDALLKGHCFLPKKGTQRAYVEGVNYQRDKLVYGLVKHSTYSLPEPDDGLKNYWRGYFRKAYAAEDSLIDFESLPQVFRHSFHRRTALAYSRKSIDLEGSVLGGNVIVLSDQAIRVRTSTKLQNVVLIAPVVKIDGGAEILAQVVARDSVEVKGMAKMKYPSSIIMTGAPGEDPYLILEGESKLFGTLISLRAGKRRGNELTAEIAPGAEVRGLVYCEGNLEINGTVNGTVVANTLLLETASGIYENHLLNGRIDRTALPKGFATVGLSGSQNHSIIASWLH